MKTLIGIFTIVLSCWAVNAQYPIKDSFCSTIMDAVVAAQRPTRSQSDKYISACIYKAEFENGKILSFRVELHKSVKDASFELKTMRKDWVRDNSLEQLMIAKNGFWDEAVAYRNDAESSHFMLLRKGKYLILARSSVFSALVATERLFRSIKF